MAIASNFPAIRPSLNLDFANARVLDPRITFGRASAATYYDGKTVAKAEENLLKYSNAFNNAAWVKATCTLDSTTEIAPDGTATATKITSTGDGFIYQTGGLQSDTYTSSIWIKSPTLTSIRLGTNAGSQVVTVTQNWTRISVTAVGNIWFILGASSSFPSGSEITIWCAQLEQRSQVTAYTPTTTQPITNYIPVLQTAPAGAPRFDHNPVTGESLGLLVEEQRTNLLTSSEQFSNAVWTKTAEGVGIVPIVSANSHMAPDGTLSADEIILDVGSGSTVADRSGVLQATNLQLVDHAYSLYIKPTGSTVIDDICTESGAAPGVNFVIAHNGVASTLRRKALGNGWFRLESSAPVLTASGSFRIQLLGTSVKKKISFACWGAQLEAGAFPASYIKTEASQVTRAADSAAMTGANFSSWYRQDEGTVFCESESAGYNATSITATSVSFHDGTTNNRIRLAHAGNVRFNVAVNSVDSAGLTNAYTNGTMVKNAACYKVDNFAYASAGQVAQTDNSGVVPVVNQMGIGGWLTGRENNGHIKRITYYPKRLPDAQLQALTA